MRPLPLLGGACWIHAAACPIARISLPDWFLASAVPRLLSRGAAGTGQKISHASGHRRGVTEGLSQGLGLMKQREDIALSTRRRKASSGAD
jgi:hypothetical protein